MRQVQFSAQESGGFRRVALKKWMDREEDEAGDEVRQINRESQ